MVFGVIPKGDSEIRIADWLNLGLDAPCVRTKVEAIKVWLVCGHQKSQLLEHVGIVESVLARVRHQRLWGGRSTRTSSNNVYSVSNR